MTVCNYCGHDYKLHRVSFGASGPTTPFLECRHVVGRSWFRDRHCACLELAMKDKGGWLPMRAMLDESRTWVHEVGISSAANTQSTQPA